MANDTNVYVSSFFTEADILIETTVPSVYNLVNMLVERVAKNHFPDLDTASIIDAVLRRERSAPTIVGTGIAMPHARIEGITRPYIALGVFPSGVSMVEGEPPVKLVFLLLIPESQPARYLQVLRALATLLQTPGAVAKLAEMTSPTEVMQLMRRNELKLPEYICAADVMQTDFLSLRAAEPLSDALNLLMEHDQTEFPVIDEAGCLVGTIGTRALLKSFVPTGLRKLIPAFLTGKVNPMESLAKRVRETNREAVSTVMEMPLCTCSMETPAREIAADLGEQNAIKCYVLDNDKRLIGVISLAGFFRRILKD